MCMFTYIYIIYVHRDMCNDNNQALPEERAARVGHHEARPGAEDLRPRGWADGGGCII